LIHEHTEIPHNSAVNKIPRVHAFLIHLAISFALFVVLAYLLVVYWYPLPFFHTDGGWQGFRIIVGVNLVLGPLLTLIVYKPGKPGLKLDLTLIALAQAVALSWGIWVTYTERPVAVVYTLQYFTPVSAKLLAKVGVSQQNLSSYGEKTPVPIYVDLPQAPEAHQKYLAQAVSSGTPLYLFTELYQKFDTESLQILKQQSDQLYRYLESDPKGQQLLTEFFQIHPELYNRYLFIPLHSRYQRLVIVVDAVDLSFKDTLNINVTDYLLGRKKPKQPETTTN
jgi:hypothetical protein